MRKRYAETLFTNYEYFKTADGDEVSVEKSGLVEVTTVGGYYGDEVYLRLTTEELERLAVMSRTMKEYFS